MSNSPGFRQIKKVRLSYKTDTVVHLPKTLSVLDVFVTPDTQDKINVPYLSYLFEGGDTELKTIRLISGEAELDYRFESPRFIGGAIPVANRRHPNMAHCAIITKKKNHPDLNPEPQIKKKKIVPDPESVKAKENAERVAQEKADFEARLEESGV